MSSNDIEDVTSVKLVLFRQSLEGRVVSKVRLLIDEHLVNTPTNQIHLFQFKTPLANVSM